jgi:hypothetical protein
VSPVLPLDRRHVRVCLGLLWLLDAALQAQPHLFTADWYRNDLVQSVMGQPSAINRSIYWVVDLITPHAAAWNAAFVVIQAALGLALVLGRFEKAAIVASIPWALGVWWVGEGFGTLPAGFALLAAGSPGPAVYYPLLGVLAWPRSPMDGPRRRCHRESGIRRRTGAAAWVVLWAGQALLHVPWRLPPGRVLAANIAELSLGEPAWLLAVAHRLESVAQAHGVALTVTLAAVEVAVGLGVLAGRTRRWALGAGVGLSLVFWVTVQYFGGVLAGNASDPGAAPLMILLAAALWPPARAGGYRSTRSPSGAPLSTSIVTVAPSL